MTRLEIKDGIWSQTPLLPAKGVDWGAPESAKNLEIYHKFSTREDTVILTVRNVARLGSFNALKDVSFDEKAINGLICFNSVRSWCPI